MIAINQPLLINILGHASGALIFAIFLCLLFSGRGWSGGRGRYLSGLAAALSLVWNLGSLIVLVWPGMPAGASGLVVAISFSALSLLPAVLLDLSLGRTQRAVVACGYVLSAVSMGMHFWEILGNGAALHQVALLLITVGFLALTAIAVTLVAIRRDPLRRSGGARIAAAMCLALFAMSFVHFGAGHTSHAWSSELLVHHAGIPLALFILLQDYRFVLLDAFVRFLANAFLAAVLAWLVIQAAFRVVQVERTAPGPLQEALLLIGLCLFLVFFAWLRNLVQSWLTRAVFRQGSLATLAGRIKEGPSFSDEQQCLDWAAALIAAAVATADYAVLPQGEPQPGWAEAQVPIHLGEADSRLLVLGHRKGGRRYLGEDLDTLAKAASEIAGRVESLRRQEMNRLVSQAELRALRSQINPHFLFNALNALYGAIPREAGTARRMVLNLAEIFRYSLQSDKAFVPLAQEMQIVRAYLELEQCRLASRLDVQIEVDDAALEIPIPALSIQPLVENAVKHGVALRIEPGYVRITAQCRNEELRISVENSASGLAPETPVTGVGLQNVRRRLEICYGAGADLRFSPGTEVTLVEIRIPLPGA